MTDKERFVELMERAAGTRAGFGDFMEWLLESDFFDAPASTKYHGAEPGALVRHSLNVYDRLKKWEPEYMAKAERPHRDSLVIAALLHDICKVGRYKPTETGGFRYEDDGFPVGHGERSVMMIWQRGLTLTVEEAVAIRWHMGAFDDAFRGGCRDMNTAFKDFPLALMLHLADMEATYLDETEG